MTSTVISPTISGYRTGAWAIDPTHSEVGFTVRHMMVSRVRGRFTDFSGEIITGADLYDSSVSVDIRLASIETGNAQRDGHLRSPDFFDTDNFPAMTYRAQGVTADGNGFRLDGELSLKGVTRTVPVNFTVHGIGTDAYGKTRIGLSGTAVLRRKDFGVNWNQAIDGGGAVVGDEVRISLEVAAVLKD